MNTSIKVCLIALLGLAANAAFASGSQTGNLSVQASVPTSCTAPSILGYSINYDPILTNTLDVDATTTFTMKCTLNAPVTMSISKSANYDATNSVRRAKSGTYYVNYNLFTSAARDTEWNTTNTVVDTGQGATQTMTETIYTRVYGNQDVPAGTYNDTSVITVTY